MLSCEFLIFEKTENNTLLQHYLKFHRQYDRMLLSNNLMKLEFDQKRSTLNAQKYVINLIQKILSADYTCAVMASLAPVVLSRCH